MLLDLDGEKVSSDLNPDVQEQDQVSVFSLFMYEIIHPHTGTSLCASSHTIKLVTRHHTQHSR